VFILLSRHLLYVTRTHYEHRIENWKLSHYLPRKSLADIITIDQNEFGNIQSRSQTIKNEQRRKISYGLARLVCLLWRKWPIFLPSGKCQWVFIKTMLIICDTHHIISTIWPHYLNYSLKLNRPFESLWYLFI
jgi:hypothetical protein